MMNFRIGEYPAPLAHGGDLRAVVQRYGIPRERWIDLSTGINPVGYPVPAIAADAWLRLPDDHDDLEEVAARHYGAARALVMAGSQSAIRLLPKILPKGPVAVGYLSYGEYERAFSIEGFPVDYYVTEQTIAMRQRAAFMLAPGRPLPGHLRYLVVVNPNNPGAELFPSDVLLAWHEELAARGGALIVDEAFIDPTPSYSVASSANVNSLIVLRSVGKFFGLAGARAGFAISGDGVSSALAYLRGQWSVSGPAREVTRAALLDLPWQRQARGRLATSCKRFVALLGDHGLDASCSNTPLFVWAPTDDAQAWQHQLARGGIWTRRFENVAGLRMSMPPNEDAWTRISNALSGHRH